MNGYEPTDTFKNRLSKILKDRNIKQKTIVKNTSISHSQLSHWLSGDYKPKQESIYIIANFLNINPAWLMGYDVPMDKEEEYYEKMARDYMCESSQILQERFDLTDDQLKNVLNYIEFLKSKK